MLKSMRGGLVAVLVLAGVLCSASETPPGINMPAGRIAITHDGNQHDLDDIGALPMNGVLLWAAGLQGRLVHLDHSNHLGNNSTSMEQKMKDSASGSVSRFGVDPSRVFDDQAQLAAAIANFKAEADKSTASDPLWFICSGPMETAWRCLNAVDPAKRQHVRCISHSSWNETHADTTQLTHTWADMKADFPTVTYYDLVDQNSSDGDNDWNTPLDKWYWLRDSSFEPYRWVYSRNQFTTKYDPSDAGMTYWLISGGPNGGDQRAGWPEAKALLDWKLGTPPDPMAVTSFTLINADTDADIGPLINGSTINFASLPTQNLNVRANVSGTVASVKFSYDGNANYHTESAAPYALAGDSSGDYNAWTPALGSHTLNGTPYSGTSGTGTAGTVLSITFNVVNQMANTAPAIASFPWADPNPVTLPDGTSLNVIATDDGLPASPGQLAYTWSKVSGPGTVTFGGVNGGASAYSCPASFSTAGEYVIRVTVSDGELTDTDTVAVSVQPATTPAFALPGRIEVEDYRVGGEGIGFHDTTAGNTGGAYRTDDVDIQVTGDATGAFNVGWVAAGEWLAYDVNVQSTGAYTVTARVATSNTTNKTLHVEVDGVNVTGAMTYNTGGAGWQTYQDVVANNVQLSQGLHTLKVVFDSASQNLNYITVATAASNQAPSVSLTAPVNGATFTAPASITLTANALDNDGAVTKVEFYAGATKIGEDTSAPYSIAWNNVAAGSYAMTAKATDDDGATKTSSAVNVTVAEPTPTLAVVSFTLVNADSDQDIGPLGDGVTLNLTTLPTRNLSVRANVSGAPGSVRFSYDGTANYQTENLAPFAIKGDTLGDYKPWTPTVGSHTLTATPYTSSGATGAAGTAFGIQFSVTE